MLHHFLAFRIVTRNLKLFLIPKHLFVPVCLYFSLKDCRIFSLSHKTWSFVNSKVWIHFIHCTGNSVNSFNLLTHVLFLTYFTDHFLPICALSSLSGIHFSNIGPPNQSSNFLVFFFCFLSLCIFAFLSEISWTLSPTSVNFYFYYHPFSFPRLLSQSSKWSLLFI